MVFPSVPYLLGLLNLTFSMSVVLHDIMPQGRYRIAVLAILWAFGVMSRLSAFALVPFICLVNSPLLP